MAIKAGNIMSETRAVPGGMLSRRFILNTGDVVDGTGLSALSPVPESEDSILFRQEACAKKPRA